MRNFAGVLISFYSIFLSFLVFFILAWDNKGAKEWWDKQPSDWLLALALGLTAAYCWHCTAVVFSKIELEKYILRGLSIVFFIHLLAIVMGAQGDAIYILGAPILLLLAGWGVIYYLGRSVRP